MDALVDFGSEATLMSDRLWKSTVKKEKRAMPSTGRGRWNRIRRPRSRRGRNSNREKPIG